MTTGKPLVINKTLIQRIEYCFKYHNVIRMGGFGGNHIYNQVPIILLNMPKYVSEFNDYTKQYDIKFPVDLMKFMMSINWSLNINVRTMCRDGRYPRMRTHGNPIYISLKDSVY